MNSTSLDLNASETLANKSLVVTTILVSFSYLIVTSVVGGPAALSRLFLSDRKTLT